MMLARAVLVVALLGWFGTGWAQSCGTSLPAPRSAPQSNLPPPRAAPTTNLPPPRTAPTGSGNTSLASGLVGYWKFDDASGTSVVDGKGGNTGSWNGGSSWGTGIQGGAGSFTGSNYVNIPASASYDSSGTWVLWFKTSNGAAGNVAMMNRHPGSSLGIDIFLNSYAIGFEINKSVGVQLYNGQYALAPASFNNQWHMLALVFSQSTGGTTKLYIDGVSRVSYTNASSWSFAANNPVYLGRSPDPWWGKFNGSIDEVGIWNRALSASEIATLYKGGVGNTYINSTCGFNY